MIFEAIWYTILHFCQTAFNLIVQLFQRGEVITFNSEYKVRIIQKIAEGGFSYVYKVRSISQTSSSTTSKPQYFAMKRILCSDSETLSKCKYEISIHKSFSHPTLMPLLADCVHVDTNSSFRVCYMLFPLVSSSLRAALDEKLCLLEEDTSIASGSFHSSSSSSHRIINNQKAKTINPFSEREILEILDGIVHGLQALHDQGLSHRDVKLENILMDENSQRPVLMDFGSVGPLHVPIQSRGSLLKLVDEASEHSTISYRAPELFEGHVRYGSDEPDISGGSADVWALGCVLFGMMYGYSPFECEFRGESVRVVECSYLRVLGNIPKPPAHSLLASRYDTQLIQLVESLLTQDRLERPTMDDVDRRLAEMVKDFGAVRRWRTCTSTIYSDTYVNNGSTFGSVNHHGNSKDMEMGDFEPLIK